jgi:hypothetical protein
MGPGLSYKTIIIDLYDYHRVELLWQHGITNLDQISQLSRLSKRVVHQYIDLLPEKTRKGKNHSHSKPQFTILPFVRRNGSGLCRGATRRGIPGLTRVIRWAQLPSGSLRLPFLFQITLVTMP